MKKILVFNINARLDNRKTDVWSVVNALDNSFLGVVKWFGRWRQYAFFPEAELVFEKNCLRTIASFCEEKSKAYRQAKGAI